MLSGLLTYCMQGELLQNKGKLQFFWGWERLEADLCAVDLWVPSAQSSLGDGTEQQAAVETAP